MSIIPTNIVGLVEVARSFSAKLGTSEYGSRGFFCSLKTECRPEDFDSVASHLYKLCETQVLKEIDEWRANHPDVKNAPHSIEANAPLGSDGFPDIPQAPRMPRRASEVAAAPPATTSAPPHVSVQSQPSVMVTAPPAHLLLLKQMANTIGGNKTEEILKNHGIAAVDAKKITAEQFEKMKPELLKAVAAAPKKG